MELNATFFLQLALFLGLLAWLAPVLWAPMLRLSEERARRIEGAADEAKQLRASASQKADLVEKRLADAQSASRAKMAELRAQSERESAKLVQTARTEAHGRIETAKAELASASAVAARDLERDASLLAASIVDKVLGRTA